MAEYEASVVINRPMEEVFAFAENPANFPLWAEGVQEMALLDGGAVALGAKVRETISLFGKRVETMGTVTAYEVNASSTWAFDKPFPATAYNTYESVNGGTRFTQWVVVEFKGFLKLASPLLVAGGRRSLKTSLQNLTKVLVYQKQK